MNENALRGAVYAKYESLTALARALGWSRQKVSNVIGGKVEPSLEDVDKLSKALGIGLEQTAQFFLQ